MVLIDSGYLSLTRICSDLIRTICTTKRFNLLRQRLELEYVYYISYRNIVDMTSCCYVQRVGLGYSVASPPLGPPPQMNKSQFKRSIDESAEGSLTAVSARLEVVGDKPLPVVAAVVGDLVRGHVLAVGRASVVPAVAPHVGQAAHRDEGECAVIAELDLPAGVGLVEGTQLHVGGGHQVSVVEGLSQSVKVG